MIGPAEPIVSGVLSQSAGIVRLRADIAGRGETIEGKVLPLGAFKGIIALVADEGEAGAANVGRQGKQTEFGRRKVRGKATRFDAAVIEAVGNGSGVIGL